MAASTPASDPASLVALTAHGLHVPDANLYLDARCAPGLTFVSHAHGDHCSDSERILCTPETAVLHGHRRGPREVLRVGYGEWVRVHDAEAMLLPAGHVLGSAMLVVRSARGTVAYTGDYKLKPNPFSPPVVIPRCDTLVMECTFGEPRYVFPPEHELRNELLAFVEQALAEEAVPVVLAYALGKAQEALWHLAGAGYEVVCHGSIANLNRLHEELGHPFPGPGGWVRYRRGEIGRRVLLTTPGSRRTPMVQGLTPRRVAYLTGWAYHPGARNIYRDCDLVLPWSDHADFAELVRTATESGARHIYTVHGPAHFAAHLRTLGLRAEHLADHPQMEKESDEVAAPARDQFDLGLG